MSSQYRSCHPEVKSSRKKWNHIFPFLKEIYIIFKFYGHIVNKLVFLGQTSFILWRIWSLLGSDSVYTFQQRRNNRNYVLCGPCISTTILTTEKVFSVCSAPCPVLGKRAVYVRLKQNAPRVFARWWAILQLVPALHKNSDNRKLFSVCPAPCPVLGNRTVYMRL
jgi:hypothetical protein